LPDEGYLIVARPFPIKDSKRTAWYNYVVDDVPSLQVKAKEWVNGKQDVYFALASFKERGVLNPNKKNYKDGTMGVIERRTQANAKLLRSFFLDLDVKAEGNHYHSQREAALALVDFCRTLKLPKPMLVSSGYGIHVYWPLVDAIPPEEWKPVAEQLKAACGHFKLLADHAVTADEARVLRVPGTTNFKRGTEKPVEVRSDAGPYELPALAIPLAEYIADNDVPVSAGKPVPGLPSRAALPAGVEGNIGVTNDPLNGNALVLGCAAMAKLVANRGETATYPQWIAGLTMAKYCDQSHTMMLAVSDGHADFNEAETVEKMATLGSMGPTRCHTFWQEDKPTCEGCQYWRAKKSPAEIARPYRETRPLVTISEVELPGPPKPYVLGDDGFVWQVSDKTEDDEEDPPRSIVVPYILFPKRIMEHTTEDDEHDERSVWCAKLPRKGEFDFRMPQTILSDPRKLHSFLLSRGLHINPRHAKSAQFYMTAYLSELAKVIDRERMFERLGWHEKYNTFVTPDAIYKRNGEVLHHAPNREMEAITKNAYHSAGTLEAWIDAISFYKDADPGYRVFFYAGFGAPLFHMTTHKGVLVAASGETGRGKTTLLEAVASIYGDGADMLVAGGRHGSTVNALFEIIGKLHSFPMFWDDTTEREPEEMREFMLHISTGKGKERMHGNKHDKRVVTWETMVLSSANTDDVHRVMATGKDSDPHLMRFVSVPFESAVMSTDAKVRADKMKQLLRENFGHAGPIFLKNLVENYEEIRRVLVLVQEKFDRALNVTPDERHWSAMMAASYVGGCIAYDLGLIPFNPRDDKKWMLSHVGVMRLEHQQAASTSLDIFNEFLDTHLPNTLILHAKGSSNIDNIAHEPRGHGGVAIRTELDTGRMFVARSSINQYCNEVKANQRKLENDLQVANIIVRKNCYKVLGADTKFAQGQVRCWEIDRDILSKLKGKK
jgi:hypothetical protein